MRDSRRWSPSRRHVLTLLVAIPGAYAVARLRFFGRRTGGHLFLAVYLFPSIVWRSRCSSSSPRSGCAARWSA